MTKLKENVMKWEFQKYTSGFFNYLAESDLLMALDSSDSLGDKVASHTRRKVLIPKY